MMLLVKLNFSRVMEKNRDTFSAAGTNRHNVAAFEESSLGDRLVDFRFKAVEEALLTEAIRLKPNKQTKIRSRFEKIEQFRERNLLKSTHRLRSLHICSSHLTATTVSYWHDDLNLNLSNGGSNL